LKNEKVERGRKIETKRKIKLSRVKSGVLPEGGNPIWGIEDVNMVYNPQSYFQFTTQLGQPLDLVNL
jgi:hypothetical protein